MANLFFSLHLMEHKGSGYDKMYEVQLTNGKQAPRVEEGDDSVTAIVERRFPLSCNQNRIEILLA